MWHIYNCDYLLHTTFRLIQISFPILRFFTVKSPSVKIGFSRNAFKEQKPVAFFSYNYRLK